MTSDADIAELIAERVPVGVVVWRLADANDPDSLTLLRANEAASILTGFPFQANIGKTLLQCFPNAPATNRHHTYAEVARTGVAQRLGELEYARRDGTVAKILISAFPLPQATVGLCLQDVTDLRRIEARAQEHEIFVDSVVENLPSMIFVKDADKLTFVRINRAGEELLGVSREDLLGKSDYDFFPREQADFFTEKDRETLARGALVDVGEEPIETKSRGTRYLHSKKIPILSPNGTPLFLLGISEDITDKKAAAEAAHATAEVLRAIIDGATDAMYVKDATGRYVMANGATAASFGVPLEQIVGYDDASMFDADTAALLAKHDREVLASRTHRTFEEKMTINGHTRTFSAVKTPYRSARGDVIGTIGISRDITERKQGEERLRAMSMLDELTGLHNRRGFITLARDSLERAKRERTPAHLIFIDVDGLKTINDQLGHNVGDAAILETAQVMRETFRTTDLLARLGGDEFVAFVFGADPPTLISRLGERIALCNARSERSYDLAVSTGVATYDPATTTTLDELLAEADDAMYGDKRARRSERRP